MNSGEGGLLTSDDAGLMARAIVMSGSYMLYERHGAAPEPSAFENIRLHTPNLSGRMDNIRAAILRPQLTELEKNIHRWNERYRIIEARLRHVNGIYLPMRPLKERYVGSSFQFLVPGISDAAARRFVKSCATLGVDLKWFGNAEPVAFTSTHRTWRYIEPQALPVTDEVLSDLFDLRLPLTFSTADCAHISDIIAASAADLSLEGVVR